MKLKDYLKDAWVLLLLSVITAGLMFLFLTIFHVPNTLKVLILSGFGIYVGIAFFYQYFRRHSFYREMFSHAALLEEKNLLPETMSEAGFYEGRLVLELMRGMGKSMTEQISLYRRNVRDFKEYIELWVHEIKLPIASMTLLIHNHETKIAEELDRSLRRADEIVNEILYYTRSETAEKDFLIKEVPLRKVISEAARNMRKDMQAKNIMFLVEAGDERVHTDGKWLTFMLGQIMDNAVKYYNPEREAHIKISVKKEKNCTILTVSDNGIGIPESDLPYIFNKSFTGNNGRKGRKSTGMGLYIVKRLCDKLGHSIVVTGRQGEGTEVSIAFWEALTEKRNVTP